VRSVGTSLCHTAEAWFVSVVAVKTNINKLMNTKSNLLSLTTIPIIRRGILTGVKILLLLACAISRASAGEPAQVTELMTKALENVPGKEVTMITVVYPPGSVDPVHRHNASTFVYVLEGSIVMQMEGGKKVTLHPGETFYEDPNDVHLVGRNASDTIPAKFLVFLVKEKGAPILVPVKNEDGKPQENKLSHAKLADAIDFHMSKSQKLSTPHDSTMKTLIIYNDVASAVRANAALQNSARNTDLAVRWNAHFWQIDMLQFSANAKDALRDALDAHLIVIAAPSAKSSALWLLNWLEHWGNCHQIKEAALALMGDESPDFLGTPAVDNFSRLTRRHGLGLILADSRSGKDQLNFIERSLNEKKLLACKPALFMQDGQIQQPYECWGINE
jgi:quercetin dioxygenase-like cupin family protein